MRTEKEIFQEAVKLDTKKTQLHEKIERMIKKNFSKSLIDECKKELYRTCNKLETLQWILNY